MLTYIIPKSGFIIKILFTLFLGILVNVSLVYSGQRWAKNFSYALTCCILPMTSLVITRAISGNFALSLGMVGALSIVRFRHPVKSPLELALYFLLVTVGISVNASPSTALTLVILSMSIIFIYAFYVSRKKGLEGFIPNLDVSDYSEYFLLEIKSISPIENILSNPNLMFSHENISLNSYHYKLKFEKMDQANLLSDNLDKSIVSEIKIYKI